MCVGRLVRTCALTTTNENDDERRARERNTLTVPLLPLVQVRGCESLKCVDEDRTLLAFFDFAACRYYSHHFQTYKSAEERRDDKKYPDHGGGEESCVSF